LKSFSLEQFIGFFNKQLNDLVLPLVGKLMQQSISLRISQLKKLNIRVVAKVVSEFIDVSGGK
jgi:hypothetical protein